MILLTLWLKSFRVSEKAFFCEFKIVSSTIKNLSSKIYLMALKRFFILENSARKIIYELLKAKICLKNIGFKASPPSLRLRVLWKPQTRSLDSGSLNWFIIFTDESLFNKKDYKSLQKLDWRKDVLYPLIWSVFLSNS